jgi:predicted XRE-type DNA-binding protein
VSTVRPEIPLQLITPGDVRASIRRAKASLEKAASEIVWQIEREAWRTLGYSSWNAMREAEYGDAAFMVPAKQRPELVARMRAKGLTQQEIADTAGVTQRTVSNDLNRNFSNEDAAPPTITNARGQQRPATYTRTESIPDATPGPAPASADPEPLTTTCPTCNGTGRVTR